MKFRQIKINKIFLSLYKTLAKIVYNIINQKQNKNTMWKKYFLDVKKVDHLSQGFYSRERNILGSSFSIICLEA